MDELLDKLSTSHVSLDEADISLIHPRYSVYKKKIPEICDQEKRRREWLDNLKAKRKNQLDLNRGIESPKNDESMDVDKEHKGGCYVREYKAWLMLSEWLIEVPHDIQNNWLCAICPEGKRALVVAELGRTNAYKRNGDFVCSSFPSWLPGGSKFSVRGKTILDTIFVKESSTFYVLDVIYWGVDTTNLQAEMRFYWLKNKLDEIPEVKKTFNSNKYKFIPLEHMSYYELAQRMKVHPIFPNNIPKVDGILFYHHESTYVHSRSPLVTWLNPFMLPDILKLDVAQEYFNEKPPEYQKVEMEVQQA